MTKENYSNFLTKIRLCYCHIFYKDVKLEVNVAYISAKIQQFINSYEQGYLFCLKTPE